MVAPRLTTDGELTMLKLGLIGAGNAGMMHLGAIKGGSLSSRVSLVAVCDTPERLAGLADKLPPETRQFSDYAEMLASGLCEAMLVATPHFQHPELSIQAFRAGLHVFCEKPAGVSVTQVREMNAVAAASGKVFAMHFNRRLEPVFVKLRALIAAGEFGTIHRVSWIVTNWFRSDAYFNSAPWRGTWSGEGGGLLINQCIHDLDNWQAMFGLPARIRSFCRFGKHHDIEVEDEATAFLEHANGMTGVMIFSTGESPGSNRIEIGCSRGTVIVQDRAIRFNRTMIPVEEFNAKNTTGFGEPEYWPCDIPVSGQADLSGGVLKNFVEAVLDGTPLLVRGEEGLASMEMENAILLSTWLDDWVKLPVDGKRFDAELQQRIATSRKKKHSGPARVFDLKDSFK